MSTAPAVAGASARASTARRTRTGRGFIDNSPHGGREERRTAQPAELSHGWPPHGRSVAAAAMATRQNSPISAFLAARKMPKTAKSPWQRGNRPLARRLRDGANTVLEYGAEHVDDGR